MAMANHFELELNQGEQMMELKDLLDEAMKKKGKWNAF